MGKYLLAGKSNSETRLPPRCLNVRIFLAGSSQKHDISATPFPGVATEPSLDGEYKYALVGANIKQVGQGMYVRYYL